MPPRSRGRYRPPRRRPPRRAAPQQVDTEAAEQATAVRERPSKVTLSDSTTVPELSELINMSSVGGNRRTFPPRNSNQHQRGS